VSPHLAYLEALALAALALPALACLFQGLAALLGGPLPERLATRLTAGSLSASLVATWLKPQNRHSETMSSVASPSSGREI